MKKVLLATTALVLSAGVASAEISLSGDGYVGVSRETAYMTGGAFDNEIKYDSRFQLNVDGSVESESGVGVSARFRIRNEEGGAATISAPRINVTAGAVTVSFGNTDSAVRARTNPYGSCVGNLGDYCSIHVWGSGFSSTGGAGDRVRLDYASDAVSVSLSGSVDGDEDLQLGISGAMGGVNASLGYVAADDAAYVVDVNGTFGTVNAGVRYSDDGTDAIGTLYGNSTFGATTASFFVSNADSMAWGAGLSHDLGGGVNIGGAIADDDNVQVHVGFSF
jgi:outer membrane protein OmpU